MKGHVGGLEVLICLCLSFVGLWFVASLFLLQGALRAKLKRAPTLRLGLFMFGLCTLVGHGPSSRHPTQPTSHFFTQPTSLFPHTGGTGAGICFHLSSLPFAYSVGLKGLCHYWKYIYIYSFIHEMQANGGISLECFRAPITQLEQMF